MAESDDQEFSDFSVATNFATFPMEIDGKALYVNPNTVAEMSPMFAAMFFSEGFKEQKEQAISINDETYEDLLEMFRCLLPTPKSNWKVKPITVSTFTMLLKLADKYEIAQLTAYCESFLKGNFSSQTADASQLIDMLESAIEFRLSEEYMATIINRASELPFLALKQSTLAESSLPAHIITKLLFAQVEKETRRADEQTSRAEHEGSKADAEELRANEEQERGDREKKQADIEFYRANLEMRRADDAQRQANAEKQRADNEQSRANMLLNDLHHVELKLARAQGGKK